MDAIRKDRELIGESQLGFDGKQQEAAWRSAHCLNDHLGGPGIAPTDQESNGGVAPDKKTASSDCGSALDRVKTKKVSLVGIRAIDDDVFGLVGLDPERHPTHTTRRDHLVLRDDVEAVMRAGSWVGEKDGHRQSLLTKTGGGER